MYVAVQKDLVTRSLQRIGQSYTSVNLEQAQSLFVCVEDGRTSVRADINEGVIILAEIQHEHAQEIALEVCSHLVSQLDGLHMDPVVELITTKVEGKYTNVKA